LAQNSNSEYHSDNDNNSVNEGGSENGSETAEELIERYKDNPEGLANYTQEKENEISQKYINTVRAEWNINGDPHSRETQETVDFLREVRDDSLARVREKHYTASRAIEALNEETYSDWTTDRGNSPAPNSPNQDIVNNNEGSSNSN